MIKFNGASKRYGATLALDNIDLELAGDGMYCLLGRNGAGKTTLLKTMAGYIPLSEGEIYANGKKVDTLDMPEVCFVESQMQFFNMKVKELISFSTKFIDGFDSGFAGLMVKKFQLDTNKRYKQLSFGMKP